MVNYSDVMRGDKVQTAAYNQDRRSLNAWTLKWLAGREMYIALRLAARRGWDDLNNLLQAAGIFDLEMVMYKLKIS